MWLGSIAAGNVCIQKGQDVFRKYNRGKRMYTEGAICG
jgi:hypothetical protein